MRLFPESLLHVLVLWLTLFSLIGLGKFTQDLWAFWTSSGSVRHGLDLGGLYVFLSTAALDGICVLALYRSTTLKK